MADPIIVIKEGGGVRGGGKGREESAEKAGEEGFAAGKPLLVDITDRSNRRPPGSPVRVPGQPGGSGRMVMHFMGADYELPVTLEFPTRG